MATVGPAPQRLRFGSWNVREGLPRKVREYAADVVRSDEVADLVNEHGLDLLVLQEVDFAADHESAVLGALRESSDLRHVVSLPLSPSSFSPVRSAGLAIASRFPLTETDHGPLPNPAATLREMLGEDPLFDKGWLAARVEVDAGQLMVVSVHSFPFHRYGISAEDPRVSDVWETIASALAPAAELPLVAGGDFNTAKRELVLGRSATPLRRTFGGIHTKRGRSVDDVLLGGGVEARGEQGVVANFSDHKLCVVDLAVPGGGGRDDRVGEG